MFDEESGMRREGEQLLSRVRVTRASQQRFCFFAVTSVTLGVK